MTVLPILLLVILAGAWYLSSRIMRSTVEALASPTERILPRIHAPTEPEMRPVLRQIEDWARDKEFTEDVMFDFQILAQGQSLFCKTWKHDATRTYLVFYFGLGRHFLELVTVYDDNTAVTTTNAPDAHTLPAVPGAFIQCFPGLDPDALADLHHEGRATLERRTGLEPQARAESTLDLIITSLKRQARYVMSIPGWQWKGLWWITVRKRSMVGKDVAWQLDRFGVHEPVAASPETLQ
jgi:hypothetical protein